MHALGRPSEWDFAQLHLPRSKLQSIVAVDRIPVRTAMLLAIFVRRVSRMQRPELNVCSRSLDVAGCDIPPSRSHVHTHSDCPGPLSNA